MASNMANQYVLFCDAIPPKLALYSTVRTVAGSLTLFVAVRLGSDADQTILHVEDTNRSHTSNVLKPLPDPTPPLTKKEVR